MENKISVKKISILTESVINEYKVFNSTGKS